MNKEQVLQDNLQATIANCGPIFAHAFLRINESEIVPWSAVTYIRRQTEPDAIFVHSGVGEDELCHKISGDRGKEIWNFVLTRCCP